jgi:hypothetical protein
MGAARGEARGPQCAPRETLLGHLRMHVSVRRTLVVGHAQRVRRAQLRPLLLLRGGDVTEGLLEHLVREAHLRRLLPRRGRPPHREGRHPLVSSDGLFCRRQFFPIASQIYKIIIDRRTQFLSCDVSIGLQMGTQRGGTGAPPYRGLCLTSSYK